MLQIFSGPGQILTRMAEMFATPCHKTRHSSLAHPNVTQSPPRPNSLRTITNNYSIHDEHS